MLKRVGDKEEIHPLAHPRRLKVVLYSCSEGQHTLGSPIGLFPRRADRMITLLESSLIGGATGGTGMSATH